MIQAPKLYVTIPELLIIPDIRLTGPIAHELMKHCVFLSDVRAKSGKPLLISRNSGYRPRYYELKRGRSGNSEHTKFDMPDRGAVDIVYDQHQLQLIYDSDFYTRICYYPNNGFFHCDRKPTDNAKLKYYECESPSSPWKFIQHR